MKTIEKEFKSDGYTSRLLKRDGRLAMFERTKPGCEPHWEVVILRIQPANTFPNGISYPERESMPPSEAWGTAGWTYGRREDADARFRATPIPEDASEAPESHNEPSEGQAPHSA